MAFFSHFKYFQITCVYPYTSHMSDFVLIFTLLYCWPFSGSALVLIHAGKKKHTQKTASSWLHGILGYSGKSDFCHFYGSHGCIQKLDRVGPVDNRPSS